MDCKKIQKILQEVKAVREKLKIMNFRPAQRSVSTQICAEKVSKPDTSFVFITFAISNCWIFCLLIDSTRKSKSCFTLLFHRCEFCCASLQALDAQHYSHPVAVWLCADLFQPCFLNILLHCFPFLSSTSSRYLRISLVTRSSRAGCCLRRLWLISSSSGWLRLSACQRTLRSRRLRDS